MIENLIFKEKINNEDLKSNNIPAYFEYVRS